MSTSKWIWNKTRISKF